jgi:hypothetical protein
MSGDESAYAALGLRPGARRAEVEEAYRRLIKLHHPDRQGGSESRAAEINRAYSMLRRGEPPIRPRRVPVPVHPQRRPARRRLGGWLATFAVLGVAAFTVAGDLPRWGDNEQAYSLPLGWSAPVPSPTMVTPLTDFEEPLSTDVIDKAIADAERFDALGSLADTKAYSRSCQNKLRDDPNIARFDACAAFDEATVILQGDKVDDSGPFSTSAVIARQIAAARMLSDDMLSADSRLHDIRSRVQLALLPKLDPQGAKAP